VLRRVTLWHGIGDRNEARAADAASNAPAEMASCLLNVSLGVTRGMRRGGVSNARSS